MNNALISDYFLSEKLSIEPANSPSQMTEDAQVLSLRVSKIIKKALVQLPNLTSVAVVDVATGICLAHKIRSRKFNPAVAAAHHAEMVRQKQQAMAAMNIRGERLEDILIPFRKQLHLIRLMKGGQWFVYLVVKAKDISLALAREILKSIAV